MIDPFRRAMSEGRGAYESCVCRHCHPDRRRMRRQARAAMRRDLSSIRREVPDVR